MNENTMELGAPDCWIPKLWIWHCLNELTINDQPRVTATMNAT